MLLPLLLVFCSGEKFALKLRLVTAHLFRAPKSYLERDMLEYKASQNYPDI